MAIGEFRNAPPPTAVDGLLAVPIHIQNLTARVTLDGAALTATADVTMTYVVGPTDGSPLFDLRQSISECWLDGVWIDPALVSSHDVGAGSFSAIRVIEPVQAAGGVHTLRTLYQIGTPQSQLSGSYPPVLQWSAGPRLRWSFGMSDLNAGRYLEAWFPSNLQFDRFPFTLEVQIVGTLAVHAVITNATVTTHGVNHWSLQFPSWFASPSHLLEIRANDTVQVAFDTVTLPVSGTTVALEAWKLVGGADDLPTRLNQIESLLTDNENGYGPFLGSRFVCFFHGASGGMEYNQATTTSTPALSHETFHSWFARGMIPASQSDGWWDEGFTTFHDDGADDLEPFDFLETPVELCSRQAFQRRTPSISYDDGSRFFRGIAATVGAGPLRAAMRAIYETHRGTPVSTAMLEADLVARTGAVSLVDAFHRFVYGFTDPSPAPRLWMQDAPGHVGSDTWNGPFWDSPDLWVRNVDDGGLTHQPPEFGQDNWLYARVRNDPAGGMCRHFVVTFAAKQFAGTEFTYPTDFLPCLAAAADFNLGPGETRVVSARWPKDLVPVPGTHPCLLASVQARGDHPNAATHVWEHANLAQKNLTVVDLNPGEFAIVPVVLLNPGSRRVTLEIRRKEGADIPEVGLIHRSREFFKRRRPKPVDFQMPATPHLPAARRLMDCGGLEAADRDRVGGVLTSREPARILRRFANAIELRIPSGERVSIPVKVPDEASTVVGFKVQVPKETRRGSALEVQLVQKDARSRRLVGGVTVVVRVRGPENLASAGETE